MVEKRKRITKGTNSKLKLKAKRLVKEKEKTKLEKEQDLTKKVSILLEPTISESLKKESPRPSGSESNVHSSNNTQLLPPTNGSSLLKWVKNKKSSTASSITEDEESMEIVDIMNASATKKRKSDKNRLSITTLESKDSIGNSLTVSIEKEKKNKNEEVKKVKKLMEHHTSDRSKSVDSADSFRKHTFEDEVMYQWRVRTTMAKRLKDKIEKETNRDNESAKSEEEDERKSKGTDDKMEEKKIKRDKFRNKKVNNEGAKKKKATNKSKKREKLPKKKILNILEEAIKREEEKEKQRKKEEAKKQGILKLKQEKEDQEIRFLKNSRLLKQISDYEQLNVEDKEKIFEELEWIHYKECEKRPFPTNLNQIVSFIKEWERKIEEMSMAEVTEMVKVNLKLLEELDELNNDNLPNEMVTKLKKIETIPIRLYGIQRKMINIVLYKLLKDYRKDFVIDDILEYGKYSHVSDPFTFCIWLKLALPVPMPNPKKQYESLRTAICFPEIGMELDCPSSLTFENMALICLYTNYDHVSFNSWNFNAPTIPEWANKDINETNLRDMLIKKKYAYQNQIRAAFLERIDESKQNKQSVLLDLPLDEEIPEVPWVEAHPTHEQYADVYDDLEYEQSLRDMYLETENGEVNLRIYNINGGLYHLNLVHHPPQPQPLVTYQVSTRRVLPPRKLEVVPFSVEYNPPQPPPEIDYYSSTKESKKSKTEPSNSQSFDENLFKALSTKQQDKEMLEKYNEELNKWKENVALEKEKLIRVSLQLPKTCIFLEETIMVCTWDSASKIWTTKDIYDVDFNNNNEKKTVDFLTSKFGIYSFATKRHANLPYISWDIRPKTDDTISITLVGSKVTIKLTINELDVIIDGFECNIPSTFIGDGLDDLKGCKFSSVYRLFKVLQQRGVDLCPALDATCYYNETKEKNWATASITYHAMAQMAITFNFSSSKWNKQVNRRSIILQVREYDPFDHVSILKPYTLVNVTPLKSEPLECSDADEQFVETPLPMPKSQPNLSYLLKTMCGVVGRNKITEFSHKTCNTLAQFLLETRVLSFS